MFAQGTFLSVLTRLDERPANRQQVQIGDVPRVRDVPVATPAILRALDRLQTDGWAGFLYWTYDNLEQSDHLWEATAGDGLMLSMLEKAFLR